MDTGLMVCAACGTENDAGRKFCGECGSRLGGGCPTCGTVNAGGTKFCGECGTSLVDAPSGGDPAATSAAGVRQAERRLVSVLFADLVGFTPFAEARDAEDTRELLSRYFDLARDVIGRYGGAVEKFIGDAVMAVWGAPVAQEDDAERAVRAGLELVDAVRALGPTIAARAGVLTGEAAVTIGAVGQGMVAGDLVNTAARLQSLAEPGTVLVGEATQRAASAAIVFEAVGDAALKGKASPVPAWRAIRIVAERGGRGRADALEAPFVGRDTEFRLLKDLFHATGRESRPRLVTVIGQGGIGKSRLGWEFLKYIDGLLETVWWHSGRSPAYGDGVTFWALGEMIRSRCGLAETDDEATTRERVSETVARFVTDEAERRWIEDALLALLGLGSGQAHNDQLFAAWRTFFERIAAQGSVVLLFEDLQWADPGLLDFIEYLLEWSRESPLFIVELARPELQEHRSDWGSGRRGLVSIALEPLDDEAMGALLLGLIPGLPAAAVSTIVRRADGIPLYAVETVRMLVAEGRLVAGPNGYEPAGDLTRLAIPESLQALIAARLDALPPAERSLVQDAAVLGLTFNVAGLAAVSGEDEPSIEPRLKGLTRRELVHHLVDPRSPERGQYAFVQGLIREVAYGQLARADRKTRHLAAARYFESLGTDELAGALAAHYLSARDNVAPGPEQDALASQARIALRGAADRAVSLGAQAQAFSFLRQAIDVTQDPAESAELYERAGRAAGAAFWRDDAEAYFERAIALRRELGDRTAVVRAVRNLGRNHLDAYRSERAIERLEQGFEEFSDLAGSPEYAILVAELARSYFMGAQTARAVEVAESVMPTLERLDLTETIADAMITKGSALGTLGRLREGAAIVRGGLDLAKAYGYGATELRARVNLTNYVAYEDPLEALEVGRAGIELARRLGMRSRERSLIVNVAGMAIAAGDWDWILGIADEVKGEEDRLVRTSLFVVAPVVFARGLAGAAEMADAAAVVAGETDPNSISNLLQTQAELDIVEGQLEEGYDRARRAADIDPFNRVPSLWLAGEAALLMRDEGRSADTVREFRAAGAHGRFIDAIGAGLEAGLAALEGRRADALAGFRDAIDVLEALRLPWIVARFSVIAAVALGPDDAASTAYADQARTILGSLGAVRWVDLLDRTLASSRDFGAGTGKQSASAGREAPQRVG